MANYTSRHTGEEIDAAVSQVASKITAPEGANGGDHLIYDADTQAWIAAPAEHTKADWNQNDENALDYVKNRTHYISNESVYLIKDAEIIVEDGYSNYDFDSHVPYNPISNQECIVTINGIEYPCTSQGGEEGDSVTLSHDGVFNLTWYPTMYGEDPYIDFYFNEDGTYIISISAIMETVHPLDEKYIPESIFNKINTNSDWNQNDDEHPAYIENRPFYTDYYMNTVHTNNLDYISDIEITFIDGIGNLSNTIGTGVNSLFLEPQQYYYVTVDGNEAEEYSGGRWSDVTQTNYAEMHISINDSDKYILISNCGDADTPYMKAELYMIDGGLATGTFTYTITIQEKVEYVSQIEDKYLPNSTKIFRVHFNRDPNNSNGYICDKTYSEIDSASYEYRYIIGSDYYHGFWTFHRSWNGCATFLKPSYKNSKILEVINVYRDGRVVNSYVSTNTIIETNKGLEQKFWRGTQEEYDAIETKSEDTMYIVTDDAGEAVASAGDMMASVYDPQGKATDIFAYVEDHSGVQPDWNQNDTEAKDYVKNRTHWEDNSKNIVSESRCTTTSDGDTPPYTYTFTLNTDKVVDTYLVVFGANEVLSVELTNNNDPIRVTDRLGEEILLSISVVQEESEIVATLSFNVPNYDGVETYVYELVPEIHKLDEKFLPDTVATKEYVDQNAGGDVFIATVHTTTYEELDEAYKAGKVVLCYHSQLNAIGQLFSSAGSKYTFVSILSAYEASKFICSSNGWSISGLSFAEAEHASEHATDGSDPITPDMIGAASTTYVDEKVASAGGAFFATFGETTNAEIEEARLAGKSVLCMYGKFVYNLIYRGSSSIHAFSCADYECCYYLEVHNNEWEALEKYYTPAPITDADNGKVLGVENGAPVWTDASGTFLAEYGVTTSAEIEAAYQAGKVVLLLNGVFVMPLTRRAHATYHDFLYYNTIAKYLSLCTCESDKWRTYNYSLSDLGVASIEYVDNAVANVGSATVYEATIGTNWTEDSETGVKTQTVSISGITADQTAKVDHSSASVDGTSEGYATFVEEENQYLTYITNGYAETVAGGIKFTIFGDAPTVSVPIVVEVV